MNNIYFSAGPYEWTVFGYYTKGTYPKIKCQFLQADDFGNLFVPSFPDSYDSYNAFDVDMF